MAEVSAFIRQVTCLIRIFAAVFIASAFVLGGRLLAQKDAKRVSVIREILLMINVMETRLRYSEMPVNRLLALLEENGFSQLGFLSECRKRLSDGEAFGMAWGKSIEQSRAFCVLLPEEARRLTAMGTDIGVTDIEGQLSCCRYYKVLFEKSLTEREEQSERSSRMFPPLGMLLGVSAAIFLI